MKALRGFAFALALLAAHTTIAEAAGWRYSLGVHDTYVGEEDSNTFGINASVLFQHTTASGTHLAGATEVFLDRDKDDLDPDHIPVWWRLHLSADSSLWQPTDALGVSWVASVNTKVNTVSSVEREIKAMPGLTLHYRSDPCKAALEGDAGWFFLEIDDDVAKERGYRRDDFRNSTFAGSVAGRLSMELGDSLLLSGRAQDWFDHDGWLENQYLVELRYRLGGTARGPELVLAYELTEYNLDHYTPSNPDGEVLPILPWDRDQFIKLAVEKHW